MQTGFADLLGNVVSHFTNDPLALLMALVGALLVGVSSAVFGYLTLGAAVDLIMPDVSNQTPSQVER